MNGILIFNNLKTIKIKFSDSYRELMEIQSIHFEDIVSSGEYSNDNNITGDTFEVQI